MTSKEIIEDFVVFTLLQYEELLSPVGYFFNQENAFSIFHVEGNLEYTQYIRNEIGLPELFKFRQDASVNLKSISDLLSATQIKELIQFLNENFTQGFPDDVDEEGRAYGGNYNLFLTELELVETFREYLHLHSINPNIYVSFFLQLFNNNYYSAKNKLDSESEYINKLGQYKASLPEELIEDYMNHYKGEFKKTLFRSMEEKPYQYQGFFDSKGFFINDKLTLEKWLEISKNRRVKYDLLNIPNTGVDLLVYKYFKLKFFNFSFQEGFKGSKELLRNQFYDLRKRNHSLVEYLKGKGFEEEEIDIILNLLTHNKYEKLSIRKIDFNQVEYFRLCYFFFIFDFLKEKRGIDFEEEKDFSSLHLDNKPENLKSRNNQYLKYYKNIRNKFNDYPFTAVDKTENKIQEKLQISKGKLKEIPPPNLF